MSLDELLEALRRLGDGSLRARLSRAGLAFRCPETVLVAAVVAGVIVMVLHWS
jgi:hypothetical protein